MSEQNILDQKMDSISKLDDQAFLNAPDSFFTLEGNPEEETEITTEEKDSHENEEDNSYEDDSENFEEDNEVEEEEGSENNSSDEEENQEEEKENDLDNKDKELDDETLLYKETHDKIFMPFKANGRNIQVKDVDEAIRLMQMGVGFHSKMTELKPAMGIIRTLEQNNLLDENKIKLFIDLSNKNPEAIRHFLKENNIDPLDIDMDDDSKYESNVKTVSPKQVEIENVLEQLRSDEHYLDTLNVINDWDGKSIEAIQNNPQLVKAFVNQKGSGVFDLIMDEVVKQKALGELQGLSDIESYMLVGDRIMEQGGFEQLSANSSKVPSVKPKETEPKTSKVEEAKRVSRRKQISTTIPKTSVNIKEATIDDIAHLDDDEFMKTFR